MLKRVKTMYYKAKAVVGGKIADFGMDMETNAYLALRRLSD